ncbi:MAG TPA: hypothetical protein PLP22_11625 [Candidatus Competibacter sp.]|nr:hypothetical protein [Candidatus Competibacteraceae bacterium]HRE55426.1 hypothetical protein [Candidatus Competibacter sp.]HUM94243.1 hypothetical protein [Candidatus Competibacter sp.]
MSEAPGRVCPLRYRYGAAALAHVPERRAETLYVIGGLYGNRPALDAAEALAAVETGSVTLCFNGDFHWFDVGAATFDEINRRVLRHEATLGNVEAELLADNAETGCGCAYPETVDAGVVERSNRIHDRLKLTARHQPDALAELQSLPMFACYRIGDIRIGVIHGDAEALAGWGFDAAALDAPDHRAWIERCFQQAQVDGFASSHTCLPALRRFETAAGARWIINNGAAGMPNFTHSQFGVITRISLTPSPHPPLYGGMLGQVRIEALALPFDAARWKQEFLAEWPPGSPAYRSYFERIQRGPNYTLATAAPPARSDFFSNASSRT